MTEKKQTLAQQAAAFRKLDQAAAALKKKYDAAKLEADEAELRLFERMISEDAGSFRHSKLDINFVTAETPYGQIQDRAAFVEWAEEHAPELVEMKERKALINALAKQHIDDGTPLPPGLGFYVKQYVSQRSA